jgi:hypothetical protein
MSFFVRVQAKTWFVVKMVMGSWQFGWVSCIVAELHLFVRLTKAGVLARGWRGAMVDKRIVKSLGETVVSMEGILALG